MAARDQNADEFAAALTRRDPVPGHRQSAPAVLDADSSRPASAPTLLDRDRSTASAPTVLDIQASAPRTLVQLPESLRSRYRIDRQLPTAGAEADLIVVEPLDAAERELRVVKLYRFGVTPKVDVLAKVRDGNPEHLVRIFEFGESDGHWYEVMEYVAQGSLRQFMRGRPLPATNVLDLVRELAIGLEHLHQFGIIHRDLKPENILVRELMPLDLVITDFGISSMTDLSQRLTSASRTVRYAAPEALSGVIGKAVDFWSLGMIVAEASLGRHPLADLTDDRTVSLWVSTRPIDLSGVADSRVAGLCRGLLLRNPSQRWGAAEIRRWLDGDTTLVAPREEAPVTPAPATSSEPRAATPYEIGGEQCWNVDELGIALAKHWQIALKDMGRGLLRKWCTTELPGVALERLFMDLEESTADPNDKLLDLILQLCPGIPPCYRGESLASKAAIAALLERAGSASESPDAQRARAVVEQLREGLLSRFQLQEGDEVAAFRTRFQEILDLGSEGFLVGIGPGPVESPDAWQGDIEYPDAVEMTWAARHILELAIALEPELIERIRTEAKAFASSTAFRFWFHGCVERGMQPSVPIWDAVLLKEHVALARHWYGEACKRIWTPRLSAPFIAPAWRALIEARFDRAWRVAKDVDDCLAACNSGPLAQADVVAALGLTSDDVDGSAEGRQELLAALAAAREGRDDPLREWMAEVRRQADPDVIEGLRRLADPGLDRQVRALVHSHVKQATAKSSAESGCPVRWSLIGLLTQALCGLEVRGQAFGRLVSAVGMQTSEPAWRAAAQQQLQGRISSAAEFPPAFAMLKDFLRSGDGDSFEVHCARLTEQARAYPHAAKSIFEELAPRLRPFTDQTGQDDALPALELLTDALVTRRVPDALKGHLGPARAVAYSPDGRVIASGSADNTIRLWDAASGALLRTLEGHSNWINSVAYSPDGRVIASGSNKTLRLWDAASGALLRTLEGHSDSINSVAYSPDGRVIASGSRDKTLRLWDAASGALLRTLEGHSDSIDSVAYSPDGRVIASGSRDNTIRLCDAASGALLRTLEGHSNSVFAVAYSPDGRVIASGSPDKTLRLWDAASGALLRTLEGHSNSINSVAYSPDGRVIASGSNDKTLRLWDADNGTLRRELKGHSDSVRSVAYSPDGRVIASGSDDKTLRLWDAASGALLRTLEGHSNSVFAVAYSPDGRVIASSSADNTIRLWDAASGAPLRTLKGHSNSINSVAYSPDGRVIASGSRDKTLRLWDAASGALLQELKGHSNSINSVTYSPDGRVIASGSDDKTLRLWDADNGTLRRELKGQSDSVSSVAYSPDGRVLASGSVDKTLRLWDAGSGALRKELKGHSDSVRSVAYSPDGLVIASGSADKTIRLIFSPSNLHPEWAYGSVLLTSLAGPTNPADAKAWAEHVDLLRSRLLTLMWLTRDWTPAPLPNPEPVARVSTKEVAPEAPEAGAPNVPPQKGDPNDKDDWNPAPVPNPEPAARATTKEVSPETAVADAPTVPPHKGDPDDEEAATNNSLWPTALAIGVAVFVVPLLLLYLKETLVRPTQAGSAPAAEVARAEPARVAPAPAAPARTPRAATSSAPPPPQATAPAATPTTPEQFDQKLGALASRFELKQAAAAIDEMIAASAVQNPGRVDQAAAVIMALEKPARGERRAARALNAQALEALPSAPVAAVGLLHDAAEADPADAEILGNLAAAYLKAGLPREALRAAMISLTLTPRRASTWGTLALSTFALDMPEATSLAAFHNAYRYAGNPEKSVEYLTTLANDDPDPRIRAFAEKTLATLTGVERIEPASNAR